MSNDIIEEVHNRNRPMPELFTRKDIRNTGGWDVGNVRAVRGEPYITVAGRIMRVPLDDSDLARAIRAHEQVHVKVSPQDLSPYINDVTGDSAIRAAEEARVNLIASMLGFPMKSLVTGSEKFDGELLADNNAWSEAVFAVAASVHTGSLNPIIVGIRRNAPVWADSLRDIAKEIVAFQKKQIKDIKKSMYGANITPDRDALVHYGSTSPIKNSDILEGMANTIELAMLLESIAAMPAPEQSHPEPEEEYSEGEDETSEDTDTDADTEEDTSGTAEGGKSKGDKLGEDTDPKELAEQKKAIDRKDIQRKAKQARQNNIRNGMGDWMELSIKKVAMPITLPGAIGRRRVASNMGRNPRRMHRMLTDPDRRVFDKFVKASGGVILIDCSGSMSLSKEELREMMEAAPGCTVMLYSAHWRNPEGNLFIVGDKGKVCSEIPKMGGGNGNDLPAIQYAVSKRQNTKSPVIWVTDGMVYRPRGGGEFDERECAEYARKNRVHMEYGPQGAIDFLNGLKRGNAYRPALLPRWKEKVRQAG